jgi:hypothetical protein
MKDTKPHKSCEQRIDQQLRQRLEEFLPDVSKLGVLKCVRHLTNAGRAVKTTGLEELRAELLDLIHEEARNTLLSVEHIHTYKLCLSYGGPADFFELHWSKGCNGWMGGRYLFQDWFDGAERSISSEEAEQLAEVFAIFPEENGY